MEEEGETGRTTGKRKQCIGEIYSEEEWGGEESQLSKHSVQNNHTSAHFTPLWAFQQLSVSVSWYQNTRSPEAAASCRLPVVTTDELQPAALFNAEASRTTL